MNRRSFITGSVLGGLAVALQTPLVEAFSDNRRTRHLILIINGGGARKMDYLDPSLAPNTVRLARESFVFEEDHCDTVCGHESAVAELLQGLPTPFQYVRGQGLGRIPSLMKSTRPSILVFYVDSHDVGHGREKGIRAGEGFAAYLDAVRSTDQGIGEIVNWVTGDSYFRDKTSIVIRPEFGRDDVVTPDGELHHSEGFYSAHRVASIFWGPDFNRGVDSTTVVNRRDFAPTLAGEPTVRMRAGLFR